MYVQPFFADVFDIDVLMEHNDIIYHWNHLKEKIPTMCDIIMFDDNINVENISKKWLWVRTNMVHTLFFINFKTVSG